ncbi:hypothetical protein Bbelb_231980 [Branchiostoma belcheri]|nr:hypothetical protein Bbelb_231980 [Branchiostoma belcheri]
MALFILFKLLALLSAMRNVSCDTATCPNCQAVYANCRPDSSQPALLGAPCAICDAVVNSEHREAIPSCELVQTTRSLWLRNYSLDHLSSTDVSHLKHLRFFYIEPGDIQHIDNNTFDGFPRLYNLSLSHNKLAYLGKQWLPEVSGHLNLAHNEIAFIEDGAFGTYDQCIETKALNLPWNRLDVIRPGYFRHLCNVMLLDLRYNRIQAIGEGSFNDMHRLRVLHLSGNKLKVVRRSWFPALKRAGLLGSLDLAKNQIQYIESEAFIHLQLLETLDLSDNQITIVALSCFLIAALRKGKFKLWRVNPDSCDVQDQQTPDPFSQHTYETVRDEDQYEVIPDSQVEADDAITPYGQSAIAGAYRMGTTMAATARTSHVTKHRRVDTPCVMRKRSQGRVPRDDKGADVAESSYNLEASRRANVGVGTRGVQEGTSKAYSNAEIHVVQVNNGRSDRDLTNANDSYQTSITAEDDVDLFRESARTTWL